MAEKGFDASKYLTRVEGRDYLEVKWRLLWLRTEHPEAAIQTDLVEHREGYALFKARVALPGGGEATGWGSETAAGFAEYLEAAETKALGRALAALGYGTQFCEDFAFREEAGSYVVDAPVSLPEARAGRAPRAGPGTATEAQVKAIHAIARHDYEWDEAEIDRRVNQALGTPTAQLTKQQASRLIDEL
ncbi:MAG: hypothetical protein AAB289_02710, partial [Chloroflexota bacterium]